MLTLEVTPERYSQKTQSRSVLDLQFSSSQLCAIIDSPGSWGVGQQAADIVRSKLAAQWQSLSFLAPDQASRDLANAVAALPNDVVEDEWGCEFDAAILFFAGDDCRFLAAGALGITVFTPSGSIEWFRPKKALDEFVALGQLTIEEAEASPVYELLQGPWVEPKTPHVEASAPFRLPQEALLVVADTRMLKTIKGWSYSDLLQLNGKTFQDHAFSHGGFCGAVILGRTSA